MLRASRSVRVVRPRQRSWLLSLPNASQKHLSSCIQEFAVVMQSPQRRRRSKQHTRHHVAEKATCACHASWTRRPAHLLSRTSSLSLQCPSMHLRHVDFISPVPALSPVQTWTSHECQFFRTSLLGVLDKLFPKSLKAALPPSCVGLGWSCSHKDVMFSRIRRGRRHLHSCEM